jgi:hypothetical protein
MGRREKDRSPDAGVTLAVKNHPELVVRYLEESAAKIGGATATTAYGFATIAGAPPGEKLEIVANKPQCNARTLDAAGIGLVPIQAGAVSFVTATLADPVDGPKCGPGPYVTMTGEVRQRHASDYSASPVAGATATFSNCPGVTATTQADGTFAVEMTTGATFDLTLTKPGFIPLRHAEITGGPRGSRASSACAATSGGRSSRAGATTPSRSSRSSRRWARARPGVAARFEAPLDGGASGFIAGHAPKRVSRTMRRFGPCEGLLSCSRSYSALSDAARTRAPSRQRRSRGPARRPRRLRRR